MRAPIPITDPADPRIDWYRDVRDRDLTGRGGFMAEGAVVLEQLLASRRYRPVSLLVLPGRWAGLQERLAALPEDVPVFTAERAVFDAVAGFPMNRGILAHGTERGAAQGAAEPIEAVLARTVCEGGTVVVACGLANHDNMGALFRNAAAFGAGAVLLDDRACDPLYRKAIRVSVGTVLTVPFARIGAPSQIRARLADAGFDCLALSPGGELQLDAMRGRRARALFLGTEGEGLDGRFLAECRSLRIAMAPGLDSLNVATSAAIALHHFFSQEPAD